ncbi:hypothetical protein TNCV_2246021 [Trichonephila clavipes]|uniref:Uncharacterized protein n=1 Tax=Trichonephila clavipes TaxID=2585209 RepID=A0A8X6RI16_TRICX|nr:hypothetical protein TNCV_2246021 [Trichonephila clavipes]
MRYDRALKHTSSVCLETFCSIFAVNLPLVRSNSYDAQLTVPNDPRYTQLETNLGIGPVSSYAAPLQTDVLICGHQGSTCNGRHDPKCPSARCLCMVQEDTGAPSEGSTCAWMATDEAVGFNEALEYMQQLSENESENDNDEEIVFSDDEYVPPDEENIS